MPRTAGLPAARPPLPLSLVMFNADSVAHIREHELTSRAAVAKLLGQIEIAPPRATTRHLSSRQRNKLRDLRVIN